MRLFFFLLLGTTLFVSPLTVAAESLERVTLQLKWQHQFQFAGYYAALEKGFYRAAGLEVEMRERNPGEPRPLDTLLAGVADYAVEGTNGLISRIKGAPLVALAAIFQQSPAVVFALESADLHTPQEMVGKRLMSLDGSDIELRAMLFLEGVAYEQIDRIPTTHDINSLQKGETDLYSGYLTNDPHFLEQQKIDYSIINPVNYGVNFYGDFLFTSEQEVAEHPFRVELFRDATLKGWQYAIDHPEEIVDLILRKYTQRKSREHLLYEAQETIKLISSDATSIGHLNPGRVEQMAKVLKQLGEVEQVIRLPGFIYAAEEGEHLSIKELTWLRQKPKVRVLAGQIPPLMSADNGRYQGILVDYLALLTSRYGIQFEYVSTSWANALATVGTVSGPDLFPLIREGVELRDRMVFSAPLVSSPTTIFTRDKKAFVGGIEDLFGQKVAVSKDGLVQSLLKKNYPQIDVVAVASIQQEFELLAAGEVDAVVECLLLGSYAAKDLGLTNIKVAAPVQLLTDEHVMGVRKDWPELVSLLNRVLSTMTAQEHAQIRQRWMSMRYEYGMTKQEIFQWLLLGVTVLVGGALLFGLWNWRLQKEVKRREKSEAAMFKSFQQFQHLVQAIPHGIIEVDPQRRLTYCNPPFVEMLGYESQELLGKKLVDQVAVPDRPLLEKMFAEQGEEDRHQTIQLQLLDKQGQPCHAQLDCDLGQISEAQEQVLIVTDLSRQEAVEKALQQTEEIFRNTIEHAQVGIVYGDFTGHFIRINPFFAQMLGYSINELQRMSFAEITHPEDLPASKEMVEKLKQEGVGSASVIKRYRKKDGSFVWGLVAVSLLQDQEQKQRLVAVIQDIDQLKRQQLEVEGVTKNLEQVVLKRTYELESQVAEVEELNRAFLNMTEDLQESYDKLEDKSTEVDEINRELESFAYSVSHDLRAPLRHAQGFAEILQDSSKNELSEKNQNLLATIIQSTERMGRLIDDLLVFSRSGRSKLTFRSVETALVVKEAISGLTDMNVGREIDWQVDELPVVTGDLAALRQVFSNLLENSVKYTGQKGRAEITVTCSHKEEELVFCVQDNGVGFDPAFSHKLFGVFSRLHRADEFEGTGIGLANVKRIVKRHGGQVWAESDGKTGAKFYFSLPAIQGVEHGEQA